MANILTNILPMQALEQKDLTGWDASAKSTGVHNGSADSFEGYYVKISEERLRRQ